jgi:hypothetical protein
VAADTLVPRLRYVPPKRRFTQGLYGITFQKTAFFIVTAVKTSNLTCIVLFQQLNSVFESLTGPGCPQGAIRQPIHCPRLSEVRNSEYAQTVRIKRAESTKSIFPRVSLRLLSRRARRSIRGLSLLSRRQTLTSIKIHSSIDELTTGRSRASKLLVAELGARSYFTPRNRDLLRKLIIVTAGHGSPVFYVTRKHITVFV